MSSFSSNKGWFARCFKNVVFNPDGEQMTAAASKQKRKHSQRDEIPSFVLPSWAVVSCAFFLFIGMLVDPALVHYTQQPFFRVSGSFFVDHLGYVGGPTEYAAAFIGLFFRFKAAGAAILTLAAIAICLLQRYSLRRIGMPHNALRYLLPAFILAWIHGSYEAPLAPTLGIAIALILLFALLRGVPRSLWLKSLSFAVLAGVVYYACGGAVVLFFGLYLVHIFFDEGLWVKTGLASRLAAAMFATLVVALLPGVLNGFFFHELPIHAYGYLMPGLSERGALTGIAKLYASLGVRGRGAPIETAALNAVIIGVSILTALAGNLRGRKPIDSFVTAISTLRRRRYVGWICSPWVGIFCAGAIVFSSFNTGEKQLVTLRYMADSGRWTEYCDFANQRMASHPVFDSSKERSLSDLATVLLNDNRMLYHVNQLPQHMFSFPQSLGANSLLLMDRTFYLNNNEMFLPSGDLLFELGRVNEAERMFFEAWSYYGYRSSILWRLARLNIVKERYEAARIFLNILKEAPFERSAAIQMETDMDRDPALVWDKELAWIRNCNFRVDFPATIHGPQDGITLALLKSNPNNRMAFEYLMGYYLLTGQKENVAKYIGLLKRFGYTEIPRNYEEAIVAYMAEKNLQDIDLGGYKVRPETVRRYQEFQRIAESCSRNRARLWNALAPGFAETYWFFEATGGTRVELKDGEYVGPQGGTSR